MNYIVDSCSVGGLLSGLTGHADNGVVGQIGAKEAVDRLVDEVTGDQEVQQ